MALDVDAARKHAGLKPLPGANSQPAESKPLVITEDATIGNEERLRGIPAVGRVSGTIRGTAPGDSAAELEAAARDIIRGQLKRTRRKDYP